MALPAVFAKTSIISALLPVVNKPWHISINIPYATANKKTRSFIFLIPRPLKNRYQKTVNIK